MNCIIYMENVNYKKGRYNLYQPPISQSSSVYFDKSKCSCIGLNDVYFFRSPIALNRNIIAMIGTI